MDALAVGSAVEYHGKTWKVLGLLEGAGGVPVAQIECLQADAFAAIAVEDLEAREMSGEAIELMQQARDGAMEPHRNARHILLGKKVLRKAEVIRAGLLASIDQGEAEDADEGLLEAARLALTGVEKRIGLVQAEIAEREERKF